MKTKRTTITTGQYDSYRIVCEVEGNIPPAISTLWKQFVTKFGVWDKPTQSAQDIMSKIRANGAATNRLKDVGYDGDLSEQFVTWLVLEHGYKRIKSNQFHVDN